MKLTPYDAWVFARLLCGRPIGPDRIAPVSASFLPLATLLDRTAPEERQAYWDAALTRDADGDSIIQAIAAVDPDSPAPEVELPRRPANLGDVRRLMAREQWLWEGWLPKSRISGISAAEGVGKTRLAMDLARIIWFGQPWPDGQPATLPAETPTLWICSDGQQDDLVTAAANLGMPDHSIHFNTIPDDPYGGTAIDDAESIEQLESFIQQVRPGLVFIDSLTFATSRDLCVANHVKDLMTPVRDVSQRTQTTIIPLLHVSKDGQALGKRIKGIARTILQLDNFDPDVSTRLRLAVTKSFAKKPPALGVTITDRGNRYDSNPPTGPAVGQPGRPAIARNDGIEFILNTLATDGNLKATELCKRWEDTGESKTSFWRARDTLVKQGMITCEGSPLILALKRPEEELDFGSI